jgi:ribosomal protein S7
MEQNHIVLEKFLNILIKEGKKAQALKIVLIVLKFLSIKKKKKVTGENLVIKALINVLPQVYVEKQRKSRRIFYFPKLIGSEKKIKIAVHWIISSIKRRKEQKVGDRLCKEFFDCFFSKG